MFPSLSQPTSKLSQMGVGKRACWQAIVITHILLISHMHPNTLIFQSEFTVTDGPCGNFEWSNQAHLHGCHT